MEEPERHDLHLTDHSTRRLSYMQPQCPDCFERQNHGRPPYRLVPPLQELCVSCGEVAEDCVRVRVDLETAEYPTAEVDDEDEEEDVEFWEQMLDPETARANGLAPARRRRV